MKKVKSKAKAKGKAKAKAKAKAVEEVGEDGQIMALPEKQPKEKSLAGPLKRKVQDLLKIKSVEEALAEAKAELAAMNQRIEEAAKIEEDHEAACKRARNEFES